MKDKLNDLIHSFSEEKVLVIGDAILDIYHYGRPLKISAETPTMVVKDESLKVSWGGAALLVRNILELGGGGVFLSSLSSH